MEQSCDAIETRASIHDGDESQKRAFTRKAVDDDWEIRVRKKSKYKPKGVRLDVMTWLKSGMIRAADAQGGSIILNTMIKNHNAVDLLRQGKADKEIMSTIIEALNVTEALAVNQIGEEYKDEIRHAQDAIYACCQRAVQHKKFVLTGPELVALNTAMQVHDAQLDICTVAELESALDYVWNQIRQRKARVLPAMS